MDWARRQFSELGIVSLEFRWDSAAALLRRRNGSKQQPIDEKSTLTPILRMRNDYSATMDDFTEL